MSKPVVEVQVRAVVAASGGCAVFLGNEDKVFVMFVDQSVGRAITMSARHAKGATADPRSASDHLASARSKDRKVIVNDLKRGTYFARLVLSAKNELQQKKIIEIDARRPRRRGDCAPESAGTGLVRHRCGNDAAPVHWHPQRMGCRDLHGLRTLPAAG